MTTASQISAAKGAPFPPAPPPPSQLENVLRVAVNGERLEVAAALLDQKGVDRLIRVLQANKELLPAELTAAPPRGSEGMSDGGSSREVELGELLRSACAIAERRGDGTNWDRFIASVHKLGLNGVTARTYRLLPSDVCENPAGKP